MNVLWLTNIPSPYRVDFFNDLGKTINLTVLFERDKASDRDKSWSKSEYENFKAIFLKGINITQDTALCPSIIKWVIKKKFDVIMITNYSSPTSIIAIEFMKLNKIPFVIEADGGFLKSDKSKLVKGFKKHLISSASYWFSSGEITDNYFKYYGAKSERIFRYHFSSIYLNNILDQPISNTEKQKLKMDLFQNQKSNAIAVGRFIKSKNFDLLIKAWIEVDRKYELIIIGSGPEKESYEQIIEKNKLNNIKIINFKSKEDLIKFYLASDLFVLPTFEDVWGLVINEAMACGLPIITTNKCIAGIELVESGINGEILNPLDQKGLTEKVNRYLKDADFLQKVSLENIKKIKNYTIDRMVKEHLEAFKKISVR